MVCNLWAFLVIEERLLLCSLEHGKYGALSQTRSVTRQVTVIMSSLTILRKYAQKSPAELPTSILFSHTSTSLTVYDAFPKSIFHFLVLPRITEPYTVSDLNSLRSLLGGDKARAKALITSLRYDAKMVAKEIEIEMVKRYGFKWEIWTGFHGAPSME